MAGGSGHVGSVDSNDWHPSILPAVRIEQSGGSNELLIRVMTLTPSTRPTSSLFEVLENENLGILHTRRNPTNEKVLHSIQVKVLKPSELDIDDLKEKLHSWAAN